MHGRFHVVCTRFAYPFRQDTQPIENIHGMGLSRSTPLDTATLHVAMTNTRTHTYTHIHAQTLVGPSAPPAPTGSSEGSNARQIEVNPDLDAPGAPRLAAQACKGVQIACLPSRGLLRSPLCRPGTKCVHFRGTARCSFRTLCVLGRCGDYSEWCNR